MKVNGQYCRDVLLSQQVISAIKQVAGDKFVFQQDSAPAHRARDTIQLLQTERDAWLHWSWPLATQQSRPESGRLQDLGRHATAGVWITRQQRRWAEATSPRRLAWCAAGHHWFDLAVSQWRQQLKACVRAHRRHFEHLLWPCVTQTCVESQYVRINYCWTLYIKITKSCLRINLWIFRFSKFPG